MTDIDLTQRHVDSPGTNIIRITSSRQLCRWIGANSGIIAVCSPVPCLESRRYQYHAAADPLSLRLHSIESVKT